ncbi:alpha-hydroxy-acid oxidizing protein [Variovorax paradoxus]|nr:alpha-hydroxy-acid oxidizing protein [Variovorax paradoxus]
MRPMNIEGYRQLARRRLPRGVFEYVDRGTEDEVGMGALRASLDSVKLAQKVFVDVSRIDLSTKVFDNPQAMPVIAAPTAMAGLLWHDGEVKLARAAKAAGIPFCISTQSVTSIEDIAAGAPGADLWFQLYVWENRRFTEQLLDRVRTAGVETLVVTADTPASPKKEWNTRNGFGIPITPSLRGAIDVAIHPRWLLGVLLRYWSRTGVPTYAHYPPEFKTRITRSAVNSDLRITRSMNWADLRELRRQWKGKLVVKGILRLDDARRASECGADGIVVSSHGARNLDSAPAPIDVLPAIADHLGSRLTILADSGVRRGSDIAKYLANGAKAVMLGRALLYGTAARGEQGAADVLAILRDELERTLGFLGEPQARKLSSDCLVPRPLAHANSVAGGFAARDPDRREHDDEAADPAGRRRGASRRHALRRR